MKRAESALARMSVPQHMVKGCGTGLGASMFTPVYAYVLESCARVQASTHSVCGMPIYIPRFHRPCGRKFRTWCLRRDVVWLAGVGI